MILTQVDIAGIRNLQSVSINPHPYFNLLIGENGAGKTSLLEALHLLASGHSFRTRKSRELINHNLPELSISARMHDPVRDKNHRAGMHKARDGTTTLKLDFEALQNMSELARMMPIKALYSDSHKLVQEGPSMRRQFLDWGLFHVEHAFLEKWKIFRQALEQRNQALRRQLPNSEIKAWDNELVGAGEVLTQYRSNYVDALKDEVVNFARNFALDGEIQLEYRTGWNSELTMRDALSNSFAQCQRFKTTTVGPHRAELVILHDGVPAKQVLSRGQQKLLVYAMHFSQLFVLEKRTEQRAIVLVDDLPAELDSKHMGAVLESIKSQKLQAFISSTAAFPLPEKSTRSMFHVEHGEVSEVV